jgi:hypothetical protein
MTKTLPCSASEFLGIHNLHERYGCIIRQFETGFEISFCKLQTAVVDLQELNIKLADYDSRQQIYITYFRCILDILRLVIDMDNMDSGCYTSRRELYCSRCNAHLSLSQSEELLNQCAQHIEFFLEHSDKDLKRMIHDHIQHFLQRISPRISLRYIHFLPLFSSLNLCFEIPSLVDWLIQPKQIRSIVRMLSIVESKAHSVRKKVITGIVCFLQLLLTDSVKYALTIQRLAFIIPLLVDTLFNVASFGIMDIPGQITLESVRFIDVIISMITLSGVYFETCLSKILECIENFQSGIFTLLHERFIGLVIYFLDNSRLQCLIKCPVNVIYILLELLQYVPINKRSLVVDLIILILQKTVVTELMPTDKSIIFSKCISLYDEFSLDEYWKYSDSTNWIFRILYYLALRQPLFITAIKNETPTLDSHFLTFMLCEHFNFVVSPECIMRNMISFISDLCKVDCMKGSWIDKLQIMVVFILAAEDFKFTFKGLRDYFKNECILDLIYFIQAKVMYLNTYHECE